MKLLMGVVMLAFASDDGSGELLPRAAEPAKVVLPDFGAEVRAFDAPDRRPVAWWPHVVNAAWGGGRGGPERRGGWLDQNWLLVDYLDRSADYTTHEYLEHRGIWYEVYGSNEYQETIHFHEQGARKLFWQNGIARDVDGQRVLSEQYNMQVKSWADRVGWNAYIVCSNAPRWSAVIDYDWLTSPLLGYAISQDNIGGPTSRIGAGGHGRYCDWCSRKFFHHLEVTGRLPEFRRRYGHIRNYVQENLIDVVRELPPHAKHRWNKAEAELLAKMCRPPVMSEYQKFLYLSHLDNFIRYYRDAKLVAQRTGREYDVHGNQGGSFIGPNPYQVALADFVDTVWFESSGLSAYDVFKYGWNNAAGAFRYKMGWAMTGGRKPFMSMTAFHKHTPDLVEHEMAEACAGGGVLFVNQEHFQEEPELLDKLTEYFRFRHQHRALYAGPERRPYARVALAYSIPTMMYRNYQYTGDGPPNNALPGMARALEEGHVPYEVVILNHPEIHADRVTLDKLEQYGLVILPALECLSDAQIELFTRYLRGGGTLGLIGESGIRDEDNVPRREPPEAAWREAGRVVEILPGRNFRPTRTRENDQTRELTATAIESVVEALGGETILSGDLSRMLWVNAWKHGNDFVSVHLVNYQVDFESGEAAPTQPAKLTVAMPPGIPAEEAAWLVPGRKGQPLEIAVEGENATVTVPSVRVHGVLTLGKRGLDAIPSALVDGDALVARAAMASGKTQSPNRPDPNTCTADEAASYAESASKGLQHIQTLADQAYLSRIRHSIDPEAVPLIRAFDFGGVEDHESWKSVVAEAAYSADAGFGWLAATDASDPTPEETYYSMASRYGDKWATQITAGQLLFWPYGQPPPVELRTNLGCGARRQFRVDVPPGDYTMRVLTTNPSWTNRNFLVSGMVSVNGQYRLLDAAHDKGTVRWRDFSASAPDGKLEFAFGGPTGWAVAAMMIMRSAAPADPQAAGGLRRWEVSPRYANPDWLPISQVVCPPESRLEGLPDSAWTLVEAPPQGLPVVDLGTNRQADVGDVAYAATTIDVPSACEKRLHFGATSQAELWLGGKPIGYVPNEKGLRRDELVIPLQLRRGKNVLVVKLARFWERRWMFYASLTDP